jgi:hypothetical protein
MVSLLISFSIIQLSEVWVHLLMHDIDFYPVPGDDNLWVGLF